MRLWHGGPPGLRPGDIIAPDPNRTSQLVDGCPTCEARRSGAPLADDDNDPTKVYVTSERQYARLYAAGYPLGWLYRVEVDGPLGPHTADPFPSWAVAECRVAAIAERAVRMTPAQMRRLFR